MNLVPALKAAAAKARVALFPSWGGQLRVAGGISDWLLWGSSQDYNYQEAAGELHRNGVVMACASWIMRAFPEAQLQVVREEPGTGEENEVPRHPLTLALRRPNGYYGPDCLWQRVVFDRVLHGQAFLYKERNGAGDIIALWHIPQHRLTPQWPPDGKTFISHWLFTIDQRQERIPNEDLVIFRFAGDPHRERHGLASLGASLREIAMLNEASNYRGTILRNMGVPSHLVQSKDPARPISSEQARALHAMWAERVSGSNRGKPIIPNFPLEALQIGLSPAELDLGTMTYQGTDEICSQFGLSAMVVGLSSGSEHKTYANYKEAKEAAIEGPLMALWTQMAQELTLQLLPDYSDDEQELVVFDVSRVRALQEDETAKWQRITDALKVGLIQLNEGRALVNLPPVPDGDVFLTAPGEQTLSLTQQDLAAVGAAVGGKPEAEGAGAGTNGNGSGRQSANVSA